jgi:hypothetical protein
MRECSTTRGAHATTSMRGQHIVAAFPTAAPRGRRVLPRLDEPAVPLILQDRTIKGSYYGSARNAMGKVIRTDIEQWFAIGNP